MTDLKWDAELPLGL